MDLLQQISCMQEEKRKRGIIPDHILFTDLKNQTYMSRINVDINKYTGYGITCYCENGKRCYQRWNVIYLGLKWANSVIESNKTKEI